MYAQFLSAQKTALLVFVCSVICLLTIFSAVNASPVYGTSSGTVITAVSSNLIIEYLDTSNNPQPPVTGNITLTDTVSAIYGLGLSVLSSSQAVPVSTSATFTFTATNKSNTATTINFVLEDYYARPVISYSDNLRKGLADWEVSTLNGVTTYLVNEDAVAIVTLSVTVNMDARDSVASYVTVNAFLETEATPNGSYVGLNGTSYGGVSHDAVVVSTIAMSPEIIIVTKNVQSIIAPTANGYVGNENDLVPGAKMIYQTVIKNSGQVTANVTEIIQNIPPFTAYLGSSMTSSFITNTMQPFVGTIIDGSPTGNYAIDETTTANFDVTKLRWILNDIPSNTTVTLNFTVVVN